MAGAIYDAAHDSNIAQSVQCLSHAVSTVTGTAVDLTGFDEAIILFQAGTAGTSATVDVKVTESATTGGTYTDVPSAAFPTVTTGNDEVLRVGRIALGPARKPFLKGVVTVGTAASIAGVTIIGSGKRTVGNISNSFSFDV